MYWALLSGIEGNLAALKAVEKHMRQFEIETVFVLGDCLGPTRTAEQVIEHLAASSYHICQGWWEEQALILHGLGQTGEPEELRQWGGASAIKTLWEAVSRETVETWVRNLDFGIQELDCLFIHGSTVSVSEALTPDTAPLELLDRVVRAEVNQLFCGRAGQAFCLELTRGRVTEQLQLLDHTPEPQNHTLSPRRIIGVGAVGRTAGRATYTLFSPGSNQVRFQTVRYSQGFA